MDVFYSGKVLGISNREENARQEAYAVKNMILKLTITAKHTVNGSRLQPHIRCLVQKLTKSDCTNNCLLCLKNKKMLF